MKGYETGKPELRNSYGAPLHALGIFGSVLISGHFALSTLGFL